MDKLMDLIRSRRSVRTFDGKPLSPETVSRLESWLQDTENPFGIPMEFRLLDPAAEKLSSPVITGEPLWLGGKLARVPQAEEAFGYALERLLLRAWSLGVGATWIGGTMDRAAFEKAMELRPGELMPCVTPLGTPAEKMSLRESLMRKGVKADSRLPFEALFFDGSFDAPLSPAAAGAFAEPLEAVRLGPSAVNKQPWRVLRQGERFHFYKKQSRGFGGGEAGDMQRIDLGIALCHFALAAEAAGRKLRFQQEDPGLPCPGDTVYIATYAAENA